MPGNKPLTREEFRAYMKERDRKLKAYDTAERTVKVMYKSLCPACEYNATHGKKIIYNCHGLRCIRIDGRWVPKD